MGLAGVLKDWLTTGTGRAGRRRSSTGSASGTTEDVRYCAVLRRDGAGPDSVFELSDGWNRLEEAMAFVPGRSSGASPETGGLEPFYLDRFVVTNADFLQFVVDGGYDRSELWPRQMWPHVARLVDGSGCPGPRFWSKGSPPRGREQHPVVGVCWYEARAFAIWAGKRLPTSAEWSFAGSWAIGPDGREAHLRYPWGNAFETERANVLTSGVGTTVPVDEHEAGATPNGIYQMVGNVWEWTQDKYEGPRSERAASTGFGPAMAEIRGGAFDTYFETQATCQFASGQPYLYRGPDVGFRCAVSAAELREPPDPSAVLDAAASGPEGGV